MIGLVEKTNVNKINSSFCQGVINMGRPSPHENKLVCVMCMYHLHTRNGNVMNGRHVQINYKNKLIRIVD